MSNKDNLEVLRAKLNLETGKISWKSLERFFAAGKAISVSPELDLLEVAQVLHDDDATQLKLWMENDQVGPVKDTQAKDWYAGDVEVWALVLSPWVLVQDRPE